MVVPPLSLVGSVLSLSSIMPLVSMIPLFSLLPTESRPGGDVIMTPSCFFIVHGVLANNVCCTRFLLSSSAKILCGRESLFALWWSLVLTLVSLFGCHGHYQTFKTAVGFSLAPPGRRNPTFWVLCVHTLGTNFPRYFTCREDPRRNCMGE